MTDEILALMEQRRKYKNNRTEYTKTRDGYQKEDSGG